MDIAIFIGPEGGFEEEEIRQAGEGSQPCLARQENFKDRDSGLVRFVGPDDFSGPLDVHKAERGRKMEAYFDNSATTQVFDCVKDAVVKCHDHGLRECGRPPYEGR